MQDSINNRGFNKLYWGFFFIMIDFRIQGIDIIPDVIGYILFAIGFGIIVTNSDYFHKAKNFNIPMIILSLFSIYEKPVQEPGINFGSFGGVSVAIGIVSIVLSLLVVYNLFKGIEEMADIQANGDIKLEAEERWKQYLLLQAGFVFTFIMVLIPPLALIYIMVLLVLSIVLTIKIMKFLKKCGVSL